jgi:hypothetical protein
MNINPLFTGCGDTPCPHDLPMVFDPAEAVHLDWAEWWCDALELKFSEICWAEPQMPGLSGEKALAVLCRVKAKGLPIPRRRAQERPWARAQPAMADFAALAAGPDHGTPPAPSGSRRRPPWL